MTEPFEAPASEALSEPGPPAADNNIGLDDFVNWSSDAFLLFDEQLTCVGINPVGERLFGVSEMEAVGKRLPEIVPVAEDDDDHESYDHVVRSGGHFFAEARRDEVFLSLKAFKVGDGLGLIASDITKLRCVEEELQRAQQRQEEREEEHALELKYVDDRLTQEVERRKRLEKENKKLRREIKELEKKIPTEDIECVKAVSVSSEELGGPERDLRIKEAILELTVSAVVLTDPAGQVIYANPSCLRLWGCTTAEDVLDKPFPRFWKAPDEIAEIVEMVKNGGSWLGEHFAKGKGEAVAAAQMSANPIVADTGETLYLVFTFEDITQRMRLEEKLRHFESKFEALSAKSIEWVDRLNAILDSTDELGGEPAVSFDGVGEDAGETAETLNDAAVEDQDEIPEFMRDEEPSDEAEAFSDEVSEESATPVDEVQAGLTDVLETTDADVEGEPAEPGAEGTESVDPMGMIDILQNPEADAEPESGEGVAVAEAEATADATAPEGAPPSDDAVQIEGSTPAEAPVAETDVVIGQLDGEALESAPGDEPAVAPAGEAELSSGSEAEQTQVDSAGAQTVPAEEAATVTASEGEELFEDEAPASRSSGLIGMLQGPLRRRRNRSADKPEEDAEAGPPAPADTRSQGSWLA